VHLHKDHPHCKVDTAFIEQKVSWPGCRSHTPTWDNRSCLWASDSCWEVHYVLSLPPRLPQHFHLGAPPL
jgi:hypothetical protein